jgi:hypothetical protein
LPSRYASRQRLRYIATAAWNEKHWRELEERNCSWNFAWSAPLPGSKGKVKKVNQKDLVAALAASLRDLREVCRENAPCVALETLRLPSYVVRCLHRNGINTVADLLEQDASHLVVMRGFGPTTLVIMEATLRRDNF